MKPRSCQFSGFTLIELMVVMAIVAMLGTLALPKYFNSMNKSREAVLRHDLRAMRDAIDQFYADRGRYPTGLDELTERRYLRSVPVDPMTNSPNTWTPVLAPVGGGSGMRDVRSGAPGNNMKENRMHLGDLNLIVSWLAEVDWHE